MIDADKHHYEPNDCFTRHIEPAFRDRAVRVVRGEGPYARVYLGEKRSEFFSVPPGEVTGPPGSLRDFLHEKGESDGSHMTHNAICGVKVPEYTDREARLRLMDEQNVEAAVFLPSLGVGVEWELRHDPPALAANLRAFNRWIAADWGWAHRGRILSVAMISLLDVELAVAELERVLAEGARIVHLKPGPVAGRSLADPRFDPFWARCQEAGVPIAFHLGDDGYTDMHSTLWGERPHPPSHRRTGLQKITAFVERPIIDSLAALVLHNLFGRFPGLRVVSIENGGSWALPLLRKMDGAARTTDPRDWPFGKLTDLPSALFRVTSRSRRTSRRTFSSSRACWESARFSRARISRTPKRSPSRCSSPRGSKVCLPTRCDASCATTRLSCSESEAHVSGGAPPGRSLAD